MNVDPAILDPGGNGNGISSSSQAMNGAGGSAGPELDPNLQQQAQNGFLGTGNAF
jgi:hypothetical protein